MEALVIGSDTDMDVLIVN